VFCCHAKCDEGQGMVRSFRFAYVSLGLVCLMTAVGGLPAAARVGVTSATDGDPTGKPPTSPERILRVGIDVVADEVITTRQDDRAHLIFLDGTSLTVSPNAQVKIDRFVYDPASQTGDIAVTATKGVLRLVGGKISKTNAITVATPAATIGIRGGIGIFTIEARQTTADFLFGKSLAVSAAGRTETALRPGMEIRSVLGAPPLPPVAIGRGALAQALQSLEAPNQGQRDASADNTAKKSGFSAQNSGQAQSVVVASTLQVNALTNSATNALAQARSATLPATTAPPTAAAAPVMAPAVPAMTTALPAMTTALPAPPTTTLPDSDEFRHPHHFHHDRPHFGR
jgi:hypothetical protein